MTTKDEVKALWKRCFDDTEEFIDLYFSLRYTDEINCVVRRKGQVVSALQMIPYPMTYCGIALQMTYISGACTHPDWQKQGIMRTLLGNAHRAMYASGVALSTLIPADEPLFGYYATSGYVSCFGYVREQMTPVPLLPSFYTFADETCHAAKEHSDFLDTCLRRRSCCVLHTEEDFQVILADLRLGEGKLLVVRHEGKIVGMALATVQPVADGCPTVVVSERVATDPAADEVLCAYVAHVYKATRIVWGQ